MSTHGTRTVAWHDATGLSDLLVGTRVVRAAGAVLRLDDGTRIEAEGNPGCGGGGCRSGAFDLTSLRHVRGRIMAVSVLHDQTSSRDHFGRVTMLDRYRLMVRTGTAANWRELATFTGSEPAAGDPCGTGTGFALHATAGAA